MNRRVYIVRHGETDWNAAMKMQGHADVELNETGLEQGRKLGKWFENVDVQAVYSSDLKRAYRTAQFIAEPKGLAVIENSGLREINVGEWESRVWSELKAEYAEFFEKYWYKDDTNTPMPGGESYSQLSGRMWAAYIEIIATAPQNLVIVSHGAAIRTLICRLLGIDLTKRVMFEVYNTSVCIFEHDAQRGRVRAHGLNLTEHYRF